MERLNKLPNQDTFVGDPSGYVNYMESKLYIQAKDLYIEPVQTFIMQIADILGVRAEVNRNTGQLTIQKFNLDFLTKGKKDNGISAEAIKELEPIISTFNDKIEVGQKSGYVKVEGENLDVANLTPSVNLVQKIVDAHKASVKELNLRTYGKDSSYFDKDIMTDKDMDKVYTTLKETEQINNILHAFRSGTSKDKIDKGFLKIISQSIGKPTTEFLKAAEKSPTLQNFLRKLRYDYDAETMNLGFGFGLKF